MNKQDFLSLLRAVLVTIGTFVIGKNVFGVWVDSSAVEVGIASAVTVATIIWGIVDKTLALEMWQSGIRSIVTGLGGLLVARGKASIESIDAILGLLLSLSPYIYSFISRKKSTDIQTGVIATQDLTT